MPSGTRWPATSPTASCRARVRARKHAAVADWLEAKAGERAEDLAEVLAHHYVTALDLARTLGDEALAASLVAPRISVAGARRRAGAAPRWGGGRALLRSRLELAGTGSSGRPRLLSRWGLALVPQRPLPRVGRRPRGGHRRPAGVRRQTRSGWTMTWYAIARLRCRRTVCRPAAGGSGPSGDDEPSVEQAWVFTGYAANLGLRRASRSPVGDRGGDAGHCDL